MINLVKHKILKAASVLMLALSVISCDSDSNTTNAIEGSDGVGVKSLQFQLPAISRLDVAAAYGTITLEMQGVDDMETYEFSAQISSDDDMVTICSGDESLLNLPHQAYYLNFIKFPDESAVDDIRRITLGAKISILDPDNITLTSSYDDIIGCFGNGSEDDPYSIVTILCVEAFILDKLTAATEKELLKGVYFRQTRAIDFEAEYEIFNGWTAAGKFNINGLDVSFCGVYDGGRNAIQDMMVTSDSSTALFYSLGDGAIIRNVKMTGLDLDGGYHTGAIACKSSGEVLIQNVDVAGNISGHGCVGGMIGEGSATFKDCYVAVNISNNGDDTSDLVTTAMGGFIGEATGDCSFNVCAYNGTISNNGSDTYDAGGYIGSVADSNSGYNATFINCAVAGSVGGLTFDKVGGLVGYCGENSNLLADNVIIGSQLYLDVNNDKTESIFGDSPEFTDAEVTINGSYIGGYLGYADNFNGLIFSGNENYVSSQTEIEGRQSTGGVIGYAKCDNSQGGSVLVIDRLVSYASINAYNYVGGFVGYATGMNLTCSNAQIYNDPMTMAYFKSFTTIGSFAGAYREGSLKSVLFYNFYSDITNFFGDDSEDTLDMSSSSFVNY